MYLYINKPTKKKVRNKMSAQKAVKSSHHEAESNMEQDVICQLSFLFLSSYFCICLQLINQSKLCLHRSLEKHGCLSQVVLTSYGVVTLVTGSSLKKTGTYLPTYILHLYILNQF